jgi:hypothetical protein
MTTARDRSHKVDDVIAAIKGGNLFPPKRAVSRRPDVPPLQDTDGILAASLDPEGKATAAFEQALRLQEAQIAKLAKKLDSQARAESKGRAKRELKGLHDRIAPWLGDMHKRYLVNKPFLIWGRGGLEPETGITPGASFAKFTVDTNDYFVGAVEFWYWWANESDQAVTVNMDGYLIAEGYVELHSAGGFWPDDREAWVDLVAQMYPCEAWHPGVILAPMSPIQESQIQNVLWLKVDSGGFRAGKAFDSRNVFRGADLQRQQITVPPYGNVIIVMEFNADAAAQHGEAKADFSQGDRRVISPGVLITVL